MLYGFDVLCTGGARGGGVATGSIGEVSAPGGTEGGVTDMPLPPPDVAGVFLDLVLTVAVTWRLTRDTGEGR